MDSRRQLKIGSVIQEAFTEILNRDGKAIYGQAFVTVTRIKVTSDLSLVRFYLSIFNAPDGEEIIRKFNEHKFELKRKLADKLRHQLRVMPEIEFFKDDSLDYAYHIEEVFKKIKEDDAKIEADIHKPVLKTKAKKTSTKTRTKKATGKSKSQ